MSLQGVRRGAWLGFWVGYLTCSRAGAAEEPAESTEGAPLFAVASVAHAGMTNRIAAAPDKRHFITASHDMSIRIRDAETSQLLKRLMLPVLLSVPDFTLAEVKR